MCNTSKILLNVKSKYEKKLDRQTDAGQIMMRQNSITLSAHVSYISIICEVMLFLDYNQPCIGQVEISRTPMYKMKKTRVYMTVNFCIHAQCGYIRTKIFFFMVID